MNTGDILESYCERGVSIAIKATPGCMHVIANRIGLEFLAAFIGSRITPEDGETDYDISPVGDDSPWFHCRSEFGLCIEQVENLDEFFLSISSRVNAGDYSLANTEPDRFSKIYERCLLDWPSRLWIGDRVKDRNGEWIFPRLTEFITQSAAYIHRANIWDEIMLAALTDAVRKFAERDADEGEDFILISSFDADTVRGEFRKYLKAWDIEVGLAGKYQED